MQNNDVFKSKQQIARELQISYSTLYRWIKKLEIDIPNHRLLAPHEYQVIFDHFQTGQEKK